jgi:hypothetical protein
VSPGTLDSVGKDAWTSRVDVFLYLPHRMVLWCFCESMSNHPVNRIYFEASFLVPSSAGSSAGKTALTALTSFPYPYRYRNTSVSLLSPPPSSSPNFCRHPCATTPTPFSSPSRPKTLPSPTSTPPSVDSSPLFPRLTSRRSTSRSSMPRLNQSRAPC